MNFGKDDRVMLDKMDDASLDGSEAIITEVHQPNGIEEKRYAVFVQDIGPFAWVKAEQMELLDRNQADMLEEWQEDFENAKADDAEEE
jgi:hypothetical protein